MSSVSTINTCVLLGDYERTVNTDALSSAEEFVLVRAVIKKDHTAHPIVRYFLNYFFHRVIFTRLFSRNVPFV